MRSNHERIRTKKTRIEIITSNNDILYDYLFSNYNNNVSIFGKINNKKIKNSIL